MEFEILRNGTYHRTGEYGAVAPYAGTLEDGDIASDACALAYLDILVDGDKGVDYHA